MYDTTSSMGMLMNVLVPMRLGTTGLFASSFQSICNTSGLLS